MHYWLGILNGGLNSKADVLRNAFVDKQENGFEIKYSKHKA